MVTYKTSYFLKLIIAIVVMVLFSSDRNLLVTHYIVGGPSNTEYMTILFILITISSLCILALTKGRLSTRHSQRGLLITSLFLALYFVVHEFIFGDSLVSAKYGVFLAIISLSLMVRVKLFFVFKILGYLGGIICFIIITQQMLLLALTNGDISQFEVAIAGNLWGRWPSCDFIQPYGLGLIEKCTSYTEVSIAGFKINRSLFFSTEPKYIASILLVTFSALLISRTHSIIKPLFLLMHLLAFAFIASASAILILLISVLLVFVRYIGPRTYTLMVFLSPIVLLPFLFEYILLFMGVEGFLLNRITSGAGSVGTGVFQEISIFGEAFGSCDDKICKDAQGLLGSLTNTYGLVGVILFWIFLYIVIKPMFKLIRFKQADTSLSLGLMILLNTFVVFNVYFFGDIFNMYGLLILITIILLPGYVSRQTNSELPRDIMVRT